MLQKISAHAEPSTLALKSRACLWSADLKAKGVKMAFDLPDNPGTAFAFISDNAGNAIELIEHKTPR